MSTVLKLCSKCHEFRELGAFSKHASRPGGLQHSCKACSRANYIARAIKLKGNNVSPKVYASLMNALSAIERKVLDSLSETEYASPAKVQAVLIQKHGTKLESSKTLAILEGLTRRSLAVRADGQLFSRVVFKQKSKSEPDLVTYSDVTKSQAQAITEENKTMTAPNTKLAHLDAFRALTVKMLDAAKIIEALANELDTCISAAEKQAVAGDQEMTKLRQLKDLLKDLNG